MSGIGFGREQREAAPPKFVAAALDHSIMWGPFDSADEAAAWALAQTDLPPWAVRVVRRPQ